MEIFLARQGIYNCKAECVAYEILYRNSKKNSFDPTVEENEATLQVVYNVMLMGQGKIADKKKAFINFPKDCIMDEIPKLLPRESIIVEVLEQVEPTAELLNKLRELKKLGYTIALDDVSINGMHKGFKDLIDIYKIDFRLNSKEERAFLLREIKEINPRARFLAEKVQTKKEHDEGIRRGYSYFQGFLFSEPKMVQDSDIAANNVVYYKLLQELFSYEYDIDAIEEIIKGDVSLSFKLLKFLNSGMFSFKNRVSSIRQAIMLLGVEELKKWISLIIMRSMRAGYDSELSINSIIRGRFCESIVNNIDKKEKSKAFIVGLFSFLDLFMRKEMEEVILELPVESDIKESLINPNENLNGKVLQLVKAYEEMDTDKIRELSSEIGVDSGILFGLYAESIGWAIDIVEKY